jgi:hypothetical protein
MNGISTLAGHERFALEGIGTPQNKRSVAVIRDTNPTNPEALV